MAKRISEAKIMAKKRYEHRLNQPWGTFRIETEAAKKRRLAAAKSWSNLRVKTKIPNRLQKSPDDIAYSLFTGRRRSHVGKFKRA